MAARFLWHRLFMHGQCLLPDMPVFNQYGRDDSVLGLFPWLKHNHSRSELELPLSAFLVVARSVVLVSFGNLCAFFEITLVYCSI